MPKAPSKKKLVEAFGHIGIGPLQASLIRDMIRGSLSTKKILEVEAFSKTREWVESCYNMPSRSEIVMSAINDLLSGYGVEPLWGDDVYWPKYQYVNLGDTYDTTIVHNLENDTYRITSWGDVVERDPEIR